MREEFEMEPANISEPAVLLWVNRRYRPGMAGADLYDVTRGVWAATGARRSRAEFAFAICRGTIVGVYQIEQWHPAGTTPYASGRKIDFAQHANDWEFTGSPAPPEITAKYIGRQVPRSGGNPVRYINA
jgi:hypothetical protein